MPVLHQYKDQPGAYAKAWIKGSIVTFQLTETGRDQLREASLGDGSKFPLSLLIDLLHRGEAYTRGEQPAHHVERHEADQFVFDFDQDLRDEKILPTCEETGQIDDLHLVVHSDPTKGQLLSPLARRSLPGVSLSIPLSLLDSKGLQHLIDVGKVPADSPCMETIWNWLNANLTESWKAFEHSRGAHQQDLGLRSSDELGI